MRKYARIGPAQYAYIVRMPTDLAEWIKEYAEQNGISLNAALVEALERFRKWETWREARTKQRKEKGEATAVRSTK